MKLPTAPNRCAGYAPASRPATGLAVLLMGLSLGMMGGSVWRSLAHEASNSGQAGEQFSLGRIKNFAVPDYYDAPNQNQLKSLLRGGEAQPQIDGSILIKKLRLEVYETNGKPVMIVNAPDCSYSQVKQSAWSSNRIEAHSGDGQMSIEGVGFRWSQADARFVISNEVRTVIRKRSEVIPAP